MEAVAMDKLVEKGEFRPQVAQAIAEALDITLKAANFVTVPVLDARFAQSEAKMEARFGSIEKSLEAAKAWAVLLYAGLLIALFSAVAALHYHEDQATAQMNAQSDARFAEARARSDTRFAEERARSDARYAEERARSDARFAEQLARSDRLFQQAESRPGARRAQIRATPTP